MSSEPLHTPVVPAALPQPSWRPRAGTLVGLAASALLLAVLYRNLDVRLVATTLARANPVWLLASVAIYTQRVPAFEALLREQGGDLPKFYAAVKALAKLDKAARDAALARYAPTVPAPSADDVK